MNPYLEQDDAWHDFHERFLPLVADLLITQVRPNYIVKIDEHIVERLAYVEIRDRRNRELVTVVELLSPSNKRPGSDREQYLAKREQILGSSAHLVEIDLLRGGRPMPMPIADRPDCDYSVLVSRVEERPDAGFWPIRLRDRLPVIPVPLRAPDANAQLDLQTILHRLYDAAGYEDYIYEGAPDPPLSPEDAAWAQTLLS
jgi:hypothetical protein